MAERFSSDLLFIIFVLLIAALLAYLIGYYVRKSMKCKKCEELEEENSSLKQKIKKIEEELSASKDRNLKLQDEVDTLKLAIDKFETNIRNKEKEEPVKAVESVAAREISEVREQAFDTRPKQDDLKIVLGIGPKISRLLNNRGINTWKQLSEADPALISDYLLQDGGERYRIHNPSPGLTRLSLADEGKWEELKDYQNKMEV